MRTNTDLPLPNNEAGCSETGFLGEPEAITVGVHFAHVALLSLAAQRSSVSVWAENEWYSTPQALQAQTAEPRIQHRCGGRLLPSGQPGAGTPASIDEALKAFQL